MLLRIGILFFAMFLIAIVIQIIYGRQIGATVWESITKSYYWTLFAWIVISMSLVLAIIVGSFWTFSNHSGLEILMFLIAWCCCSFLRMSYVVWRNKITYRKLLEKTDKYMSFVGIIIGISVFSFLFILKFIKDGLF